MAWRALVRGAAGGLLLLLAASTVTAQDGQNTGFFQKPGIDGVSWEDLKTSMPEYFGTGTSGGLGVADIPEIYGPGAVLNVGDIQMKVTNYSWFGNPYTNLSSDPSGQWPGASGTEYLNGAYFAVGAVNPYATDPNAIRRVSFFTEWRPPSLDPVDKIYRTYDGALNGARFVNDDGDVDLTTGEARIDEDFLDGHDNDLDGKVDEDFAAQGQQTFSCVIRDDTETAINATAREKHVPLGLEVQQLAWAYSIPGYTGFNVVQYKIFNRAGHSLDSVYVGALVDMDCGPVTKSAYWSDDIDMCPLPNGSFRYATLATDKRLQDSTMRAQNVPPNFPVDSALCSNYEIRVNGFSIVDDDGDEGHTPGIGTFLLVNHSVDPLGESGPVQVGFHAFRSFTSNTPYASGGSPSTDAQRFEFMSGAAGTNIGDEGFINQEPVVEKGDMAAWWSCGPWLHFADGASIEVTVAFAVAQGTKAAAGKYRADYQVYAAGGMTGADLMARYPSLENAFTIQVAYEGIYEENTSWSTSSLPNGHGRETRIQPAIGEGEVSASDCHDQVERLATHDRPDWFDFDCNYCTGAYDSRKQLGMLHRTWNADAPPPNPAMNVSSDYNYSDNPNRIVPAGDNQVLLAWDNLSQVTPDPKSGWFDLRGFRVWKAANWTRPVGSAGPSEDDWALLGEFRYFHYYTVNGRPIERNYKLASETTTGVDSCPRVFVPTYNYPVGSEHCPNGCRDTATVDICLADGDLWNRQSGEVIHPTPMDCVETGAGTCDEHTACILGRTDCDLSSNLETFTRYPVGRYRYVDKEVKNGFVYFYSVTAFDSTGTGKTKIELSGRRAGTEADGVVPQAPIHGGKNVWVVPNPYRGYTVLRDRPSSWDLTPNASDPTGTHIDFMGLPSGAWTIRIYTVAGDLVQTIRSVDAVNESIRPELTSSTGVTVPGYNRQQDNANDGQASWNLISRNGQDIVSGIYLFTVDSSNGTQRGKFVVIR
jgi:hypothetical protein